MASMTISVDDGVKRAFSSFCNDVGLSASSLINVFMVTTVRERRVPFAIAAPSSLRDEIAELESDVEISRRQFAEGKGIPSDVVFDRLHKKLLAMKQAKASV